MKEHQILFKAEMVRAILAGTKNQTRRIMKLQPTCKGCLEFTPAGETVYLWPTDDGKTYYCKSPYGTPGDHLWVRETWAIAPNGYVYRANYLDGGENASGVVDIPTGEVIPLVWRPSIFMPRTACRILLEVVNVRVERLHSMSEADAIAEGVERLPNGKYKGYMDVFGKPFSPALAKTSYSQLWETLNAKRGFAWKVNPWVWVIEFQKVW
jgi:hypothetical protein